MTILGPSGCGKTTLFASHCWFSDSFGRRKSEISGDGNTQTPPHKRPVNTVFQKYALFPHMNVYDNIAFGLKLKKEPKDIIEQKVKRMLKLVNLEEFADRSVTAMSGGQQQRVAIARAIVCDQPIILADEPTGSWTRRTKRMSWTSSWRTLQGKRQNADHRYARPFDCRTL